MTEGKICIKDEKGTIYIFTPEHGVMIDGKEMGKGKLVTPVSRITLFSRAFFTLNGGKFRTGIIKGFLSI